MSVFQSIKKKKVWTCKKKKKKNWCDVIDPMFYKLARKIIKYLMMYFWHEKCPVKGGGSSFIYICSID